MELEYAFLCDYADQGQKLTAVGIGIDAIHAPEVPVVHPMIFAVAGIRFERPETNRARRLEVELVDADGNPVIPRLEAEMQVGPPAPGFSFQRQRIVLGINGATFPRYGDYEVNWLMDGVVLRSTPLKVLPIPEQNPAPPSP